MPAMPLPDSGRKLSRIRVLFLGVVVASAYTVWGVLISLQPPFYPLEAEAKGATPHQYGFVFGIFNLAAMVGGPLFGKLGVKVGPRVLYVVGGFAQGICGFAFGFLTYINHTGTFIGLSYALRAAAGLADAAGWGAVLSILLKIWPEKVAVIMSATEGFFGLGFMLGPALGAGLYNLGGFVLPFALCGGFGILVATAMVFVIPSVEADKKAGSNARKLGFRTILTSPTILLPFIDNFCCFFGNGFIEAMLQPHINQSGGTVTQGGMVFFAQGGVFMVSMFLCGFICDKLPYPTFLSCFGNVILTVAFVFFGPLPWMGLSPDVSLITGCGGLVGLGYACIMVSTFARAQGAAARMGYPKDISTYLMISGMWTSSLYLGCFAGPTLAGFLVEYYDFRTTTVLFWATYLAILVADTIELAYFLYKGKSEQRLEYQELS